MSEKRDRRTTDDEGRPLRELPRGVSIREVPTHVDERGSVHELLDTRWPQASEPASRARWRVLAPGTTTGLPAEADRVALLFGEVELSLDDGETQSRVNLSHFHRCLVVLPEGVRRSWRVLGSGEAVLVHLPS